MNENILTREQRRKNGFLGKKEDIGEQMFRKVCEQRGYEYIRFGWRGQDEEDPAMRNPKNVDYRQIFAPDFATDISYVEVQYFGYNVDYVRIKEKKYKCLDKWWNDCKNNGNFPAKPLRWFFYDKKNKRWTICEHEFIHNFVSNNEKVQMFPGHPTDGHKMGWKVPLELFSVWQDI